MKAEVTENGIVLSDVDSPVAIEAFLKGLGFNADWSFSFTRNEDVVRVYAPLKKETEHVAE